MSWHDMDADLYRLTARSVRRPRDDIDTLVGIHRKKCGFTLVRCSHAYLLRETDRRGPGISKPAVKAPDSGIGIFGVCRLRYVAGDVGRRELDRLARGIHLAAPEYHLRTRRYSEDVRDIGRYGLAAGFRI